MIDTMSHYSHIHSGLLYPAETGVRSASTNHSSTVWKTSAHLFWSHLYENKHTHTHTHRKQVPDVVSLLRQLKPFNFFGIDYTSNIFSVYSKILNN